MKRMLGIFIKGQPRRLNPNRRLFIIASLVLWMSSAALGATYYSQGSVSPNTLASWNTVRTGGGTTPANFTAGDQFVIQNGHLMTPTAAWSVTGTDALVRIESGGTLYATYAVSVPIFEVDGGGTYNHSFAAPGGGNGTTDDFPGTSSRSVGLNSTVKITKWATASATAPAALPNIWYGNLTINVPAWAGSLDMNVPDDCSMTVSGNLVIQATGGGSNGFCISRNHNITLNVGGDLEISGGTFSLTDGGIITTYNLNIGGDLNFTGGTWAQDIGGTRVHFTGGTQYVNETITGTFSGLDHVDWIVDAGKILTLTSDHLVGNARTFQVFGRLNCGAHAVTGDAYFVLESGGTLGIGSRWGITGSPTALGNILVTGLRTYSQQANYVYDGSGAGIVAQTGSGLPARVNNLTINKPDRIYLSNNCTVDSLLTLDQGWIGYPGHTLFVASDLPINRTSGYVYGNLSLHVATGAAARDFPVGDTIGYSPISVAFSNVSQGGMLNVEAVNHTHSNVAISANALQRYWALSGDDSLAFDSCSATLNYLAGDFNAGFTEAADEATMVAGRFGLPFGPWTLPAVDALFVGGPADGGSIVVSGLTAFGDLTMAKDTASIADMVPPQIKWTWPHLDEIDVFRDTPVVIAFTKPINGFAFTSNYPGLHWAPYWNAGNDTVTITHDDFLYGSYQTFEVTEARDYNGNALVAGVVVNPFSFTVASDPDEPYVTGTWPGDAEGGVLLDQPITIAFSEPMDTVSEPCFPIVSCSPDPGGWALDWSESKDTLVLYHNDFAPEQTYSLGLVMMKDADGHTPLTAGPAPLPFNFTTGTTGLAGTPGDPLNKFYFNNATPNPASGNNIRFEFGLPQSGQALLEIYNVMGQKVKTLAKGPHSAGRHILTWNGCDDNGGRVSPGVFIYRLKASGRVVTKKLTVVR